MRHLYHYLFFNAIILNANAIILNAQSSFDWQAHRGGRGLMPENSLPAFQNALEMGVTTLEMDVVISKDKQVVVSHEPFFSAKICQDKNGEAISNDSKIYNLYQFTYAEIQSFDCGSKGNINFPEQQRQKVFKPLLSEVLQQTESYCHEKNSAPVYYNIEIKSTPETDSIFHPGVSEFSDLVYQVIQKHVSLNRIILQCSDFRVLKYWKEKYPSINLAALVSNTKSIKSNLAEIGFTPQIYSPYYKLLMSKNKVDKIHSLGMQVIPWTVNKVADMKRLKEWGVDGIITDYPNRIKEIK